MEMVDIIKLNEQFVRCAYIGDVEGVKAALEAGADIHAWDDYALRVAADNGQLEAVKALMEAGADVDAMDDWALRKAADNGHAAVVALLEEAIKTKTGE